MANQEQSQNMPENVIIPNPEKLDDLIRKFKEQGQDKIHVLADFDRTLTKAFVKGKSFPSIISQLRDGNYLTPDYAAKAQALFDNYHPIEIDPNIPHKEKTTKMQEWWQTHFDLLIASGLNKKDLQKVASSGAMELRSGALKFLSTLNNNQIPLIILSSSGLGEAIPMYLQKEKCLFPNIHIITNYFEWDKDGQAIGIKKPLIHTLNKSEIAIKNYSFYDQVKNRTNVILLGDNLDDLGMVEGFDYDNLLKIGFLNDKVEDNLEAYKQNFDVGLLNDMDMGYVNKLLSQML